MKANKIRRCCDCTAIVITSYSGKFIRCDKCREKVRKVHAAHRAKKYKDAKRLEKPLPLYKTVFEAILLSGRDDDFRPLIPEPTESTLAKPGSQEKILALCERVKRGEPLWHKQDGRYGSKN